MSKDSVLERIQREHLERRKRLDGPRPEAKIMSLRPARVPSLIPQPAVAAPVSAPVSAPVHMPKAWLKPPTKPARPFASKLRLQPRGAQKRLPPIPIAWERKRDAVASALAEDAGILPGRLLSDDMSTEALLGRVLLTYAMYRLVRCSKVLLPKLLNTSDKIVKSRLGQMDMLLKREQLKGENRLQTQLARLGDLLKQCAD